MRPRSLVPLLVLFTLGCRPRSDGGEAPGASVEVGADPAGEAGPTPERPERPAGVIYRSELIRATRAGSAPYLLGQIGPEPYSPQGRFEGWIITRVWPGDPELCAPGCDLQVGDIILSVNGSRLETPEQLSSMLADIEVIDAIELTGIRDGAFFQRTHPVLE
jgi:type II secretory pathway component PulC